MLRTTARVALDSFWSITDYFGPRRSAA
jgi:hypothetical protein